MECESCGAKTDKDELYLVSIEGAQLEVCYRCKRLGKILRYPKAVFKSDSTRVVSTPASRNKMEFELVEGYGDKIRNSRIKMKLPISVVAEMINEKESFLDRVEKQKTRPSPELARKIEKELGIKILEESGSSAPATDYRAKANSSKGVTLGDILELELKKKKSE